MMIETQRLMMRPFTLDDEDIISALYGDPEIMTYMPCGCLTDEGIRDHVRQVVSDWDVRPQTNYEMAVIAKSDSRKIGRARIHMDYESDTAMLGWLLVRSEWGKGYATEITKSLLKYCFDVMQVHRVCALCHPNNIGSWKVMEKCGLRKEAHYVQKVKYVGAAGTHWEDELEYAILNEEFQRM
ncbi:MULTISPECIES: GNAT family N-acetyltransferase [Bifidobacterium]|uniref:GNAT family N-acetyltransferase n=1 Tax=Bifidobacterium TaxID=1678 RepID=UPI001BDD9FCB|nr:MULTISPECIES: GNAT family N-acetyltransferase [Bifidobacterium]MBT1160345.1 GNAT family N-acetyltransferase [Bifidobacterium sp. SO1]MBW3079250.1 GNAT family N-acetyltransferase [Bifidobacterium simiiventris]